jgi:hypothetical protein
MPLLCDCLAAVPYIRPNGYRTLKNIVGLIGVFASATAHAFAAGGGHCPFNQRERVRLAPSQRRCAAREIDCYCDVADEARASRIVLKR